MDLHKIQNKAKEGFGLNPEENPWEDYNGCRCLSSWIDLEKNRVVSLLDVPDETALKKQLTGNQYHEILPVNSKVAEVFLERLQQSRYISGREKARFKILKNGEEVRVLLVVAATDPDLLKYQLGEKAFSFFNENFQKITEDLFFHLQGKQIDCQKNYCVASFISVFNAISCAVKIKKKLSPFLNSAKVELFLVPGDASKKKPDPLTEYHFHSRTKSAIVVASQIKEMCGSTVEKRNEISTDLYWLKSSEEKLLKSLLQVLNQNWQNPNFNCKKFRLKISMSKASLYRKCTAITGRSPNALIKEYRLLQALGFLRAGDSVTRSCYDTGFNSASYFSRCFKKQFNIQPGVYRKLCET